MTSLRQIESNRRNAQKSTGPKTDDGKARASRSAVRHGLTAETVIKLLEDPDDYRAFEQAVTADYDAVTAVERELVLRLASLLWRLRRATAIETGLLRNQHRLTFHPANQPTRDATIMTIFQPEPRGSHRDARRDPNHQETQNFGSECSEVTVEIDERGVEVARCFLGLADLDKGAFERLGRYEAALWRQVRQTISRCSIYKCERPTDDFGEHRIGGKEPLSRPSKVARKSALIQCSIVTSNGALKAALPARRESAPSLAND